MQKVVVTDTLAAVTRSCTSDKRAVQAQAQALEGPSVHPGHFFPKDQNTILTASWFLWVQTIGLGISMHPSRQRDPISNPADTEDFDRNLPLRYRAAHRDSSSNTIVPEICLPAAVIRVS